MNDLTHSKSKSPYWSDFDGVDRIPYGLFQDPDVAEQEQRELFDGPTWSYLCLDVEIPDPGDFVATHVGSTPVIVTRDRDGQLYAFENRCAHRGSLLALEDRGNVKDFTCVYHAWTHNLQGDLVGVAFEDGMGGKGGMARDFCKSAHGPRKLRVTSIAGLVFGSFDNRVQEVDDYLGTEVRSRVERIFKGRRPVVLGRFTQVLPNNWKLYVENTKDSYHASILHTFFATFELNKLSQKGGLIVSESGGCHVSHSAIDRTGTTETDNSYAAQNIRSESDLALSDTSMLGGFDEFGDGTTLQILSIFPNFVLQQIQNSIAVRCILPKGIDETHLVWTYIGFESDTEEQRRIRLKQSNLVGPGGYVSMEDGCIGGFVQRGITGARDEKAILQMGGNGIASSEDRISEAAIRGFWTEYRERMGL